MSDVFTKCFDLVHSIAKQNRYPGWTETELEKLQKKPFLRSRPAPQAVFGLYQASGMSTSKWHALGNVLDAFQQIEGTEYFDHRLYEGSHEQFQKYVPQILKKTGE